MDDAREPDWNDLRYFLAVARGGSFAAAARRLGVRHSTVARRLHALETAIGAALAIRQVGGVELTDLGRQIIPLAETVEAAVTALVMQAHGGPRRIKLAVPTGFAAVLASEITAFHLAHPDIGIDLASSSNRVDLRRGEADLALRIGATDDPNLVARTIGHVGLSLYASRIYLARMPFSGDPEDLAGHRIIGLHDRLAAVPAARWIEAHASGATVSLRLSGMDEALAAAVDGAGIALLPCVLAERDSALVRLTDRVVLSLPAMLVFRRDTGNEPQVRRVIRMLAGAIRKVAASLAGDRVAP